MFAGVLQAFLLVFALTADAFAAGFSYGVNKVKIPMLSAHVINSVCTALLAAAVVLGALSRNVISSDAAVAVSFVILLALGLAKLFDSLIKSKIKSGSFFNKFSFKLFSLNFILHVYAEPEQADIDASRILSPKEAVYLAVALSLDGLSVGFGTGLSGANPALVVVFSFIMGFPAVMLGALLGRRVAEKLSLDLTWLSGLVLIFLAFLRLT